MPLPNFVPIDKPLTNVLIAYVQAQEKFIADKLAPVISVKQQGGLILGYAIDDWTRIQAQERAPGTESAGGGFETAANLEYFARRYDLHKDIPSEDYANAEDAFSPDSDASEFLGEQMLIKKEALMAAAYFATSIWTTDLTGITGAPTWPQFKRFDESDSTPIETIDRAKETVELLTGKTPNLLIVGKSVHRALKNHSDLLDRIKYTQKGQITAEIIASLLEVDRYMVARSVYNTSAKGAAKSMSYILDSNAALLAYVEPSPGRFKPSAAYTIAWTGLKGMGSLKATVKKWYSEDRDANRIESSAAYQHKVIAPDLGVFLSAAVS